MKRGTTDQTAAGITEHVEVEVEGQWCGGKRKSADRQAAREPQEESPLWAIYRGSTTLHSPSVGFRARNAKCLITWFPVGTNNEDSVATTSSKQSVAYSVGIPQGPTINPIGHYDQKAPRSYADVVRDNRSTHSIELIK